MYLPPAQFTKKSSWRVRILFSCTLWLLFIECQTIVLTLTGHRRTSYCSFKLVSPQPRWVYRIFRFFVNSSFWLRFDFVTMKSTYIKNSAKTSLSVLALTRKPSFDKWTKRKTRLVTANHLSIDLFSIDFFISLLLDLFRACFQTVYTHIEHNCFYCSLFCSFLKSIH